MSGAKWYFLDGPPFPSSDTPHLGTAWNKILKDTMVRFKRMQGFNVRDQPGYDCHGLPIELEMERRFGVGQKHELEAVGLERFISECIKFAKENSKSMSAVFADLGVWMDWDHPYMTLDDSYMESVWWAIKEAHRHNLFEHTLKVVHWCPRCETALSDYEVAMKYTDLRDPSIYVKFPVKGKPHEYIVIWTTTPWTLPSNVAVMVNPNFTYAKATDGQDQFIMALDRVEALSSQTGVPLTVLDEFPGAKLEGLEYESPLRELVPAQRNLVGGHRVVLSEEYVSLEEGTGCVHSAPGHGEQDFEVGTRNRLPVLMLVDDQGRLLSDAGQYSGQKVHDANPHIVDDLKRSGHLLFADFVVHRAPLCWRCDTPLVIRATEQWAMLVTKFKKEMLRLVDETYWVPDWAGASQFTNWLRDLKDWVISRQRFWGTPLPVWLCKNCGRYDVIGSKRELIERSATKTNLDQLHIPWVDTVRIACECGGEKARVPDVIVGWFDSGSSSYASLSHPQDEELLKYWWPADFIVEGRDQISGWFFALMRCSLLSLRQNSFRSVLMHGFMLDESGREMHKSLGNYVTPQEAIARVGRDPLRYYLLQSTTWEDLRFSWKVVEQMRGDLNTFWNTLVFASTYMNLDKFDPTETTLSRVRDHLRREDRWILSRTQTAIASVTEHLEKYRVHEALRLIRDFLIEDLSHNYVRWVRRRTWIERDHPDKRAAYVALYHALKAGVIMLAPILPFFSESAYQEMLRPAEKDPVLTVHAASWPEPDRKLIDVDLEQEMLAAQAIISAVAQARMKARLKLRQPVHNVTLVSDEKKVRLAVRHLKPLLLEQMNSKRITLLPTSREKRIVRTTAQPNSAEIGPQFRNLSSGLTEKIRAMNAARARQTLAKTGKLRLTIGGKKVVLEAKHLKFREQLPEGVAGADFPGGRVYVDTKLTPAELIEGLTRDLVRRMQQMRKELDLRVDAFVDVKVAVHPSKLRPLKRMQRYIKQEVRAQDLQFTSAPIDTSGYTQKEWRIDDERFTVAMKLAVAKERIS
jgi:isoleucyl-tRNA synthetase